MTTLEQQFGVNAVGAMVAREFGDGIIYHGTIISFKRGKDGEGDLYRVEYDDGDLNYHMRLHLWQNSFFRVFFCTHR